MADSCGLLCCHPKWFQRFANTRWFIKVYGLLGMIQATSFLYFVVTLSTIERRFKIPSQTTASIPTERIITSGSCFGDCTTAFYTFAFISMCSSLVGSTGRIGNVLLNFRAVEPRDKPIAQGFSLFMISLFALIPGPIIFGRIIDSTCLVWSYKCGERGNCQLYDPLMFRYLLHIISAGFIFLGVCFDVLVWYFAQNLELYGEDENDEKNKVAENSAEQEPLNKN